MSNSNQMPELAGLVDNLYLNSKNRIGVEAPPTPQRHRHKKVSKNNVLSLCSRRSEADVQQGSTGRSCNIALSTRPLPVLNCSSLS